MVLASSFIGYLSSFASSLPSVVEQGFIWGIMAIGLYLSYKILDFADLTVDGSFALGGITLAVLMKVGVPVGVAMLVAFGAGLLAGLVTGLLHTFLGIPAILAGILTQIALWSVNLLVSKGLANVGIDIRNQFVLVRSLTDMQKLYSILFLIGFIAAIIGLLYWFFGTEMGSAIRATGSNETMARANGINTTWMKIIALSISNGLVALSGSLSAQFQGSGDINMGKGAIVIGLAAIVIGLAIFKKAKKNFALHLIACVVGATIYYFVYQLVLSLNISTNLFKLLSAAVVAVFLGVPYLRKKINFGKWGKKNA